MQYIDIEKRFKGARTRSRALHNNNSTRARASFCETCQLDILFIFFFLFFFFENLCEFLVSSAKFGRFCYRIANFRDAIVPNALPSVFSNARTKTYDSINHFALKTTSCLSFRLTTRHRQNQIHIKEINVIA